MGKTKKKRSKNFGDASGIKKSRGEIIKKEVNRVEELEKLKNGIVENMKKMCSYCNIIPYQNQLGIGYTS